MVSQTLTVINKQGLHMRPARVFVRAMSGFESALTIRHGGRALDGKSIMQVMTACIQQGAEIELECTGPDEGEMLAAAVRLIEAGLEDEI